jgi:hypothetical protein
LDKTIESVCQSGHEPEAEVDVDGEPGIVGIARRGTLGDVVHHAVHGEEELEELPPLGEVDAASGDLKLDIGVDIDAENGVGVRGVWDLGGERKGGQRIRAWDHGKGVGDPVEVETI